MKAHKNCIVDKNSFNICMGNRLFFFFADRHKHAWLKQLSKKDVEFGSGKRKLVEGGKFDNKYQITVPEDLDGLY